MVLQTIEERLRRVLPPNIILTRINIDQLLVVLDGINNHAEAEATAESIRAIVAQSLPNQGAWSGSHQG
jgi:GGDEF domain-containing protein